MFIENRQKLAAKLKPRSIAVLNSSDILPGSADGTRPFVQQTDIFYLSNIDQEESTLVVFPDAREEKHREILFLKETSEHIRIWEGDKLAKEEATGLSGVKTVYWNHQREQILTELIFEAENIYLNTNEHLRAERQVETRDDRFIKWCKDRFPLHRLERLAPIMHHLRAVKSEEEVKAIGKACKITEDAFARVLKFVKPGVMEYEVEAEIMHEFIRNGSRRPAYDPIVASGYSSCVLHYISNDKPCKDGDLLLMDFGAEYGNYAADLTRTIPVNGEYTARQKQVYNAVLRVQKAAIDMLRPGNNLKDYHKEVGKLMEGELIAMGLLDAEEVKQQNENQPLYKKYFMHGTAHHLGLDVHDYGNKYRDFEAGMVFTCEPGIYLPDESIGVRIENDILITNDGPVDLMANIPREVEEIEEIMNS